MAYFSKLRVVFYSIFWASLMLLGAATAYALPPSFSLVPNPDTVGPGSTSTVTFTIDNTAESTPISGITFTNTWPAGIINASPANESHNCGGTFSGIGGATTITYTGGTLGGGSFCTLSVDVIAGYTAAIYPIITGDLTSSAGNSGKASGSLTVNTSQPGFSKSFAPSSVSFGGTSTLTFTIDNTLNASGIPNLDFTDNFPTGMVIASPANASTDCESGLLPTVLTAPAGGTSVILNADGFLPVLPVLAAGATCTVTVDVVGNSVGSLTNVSGDLLADFVSAGKASDTLTVTSADLLLTKSFTNDPVAPGDTVDLEFTIQNTDRVQTVTGIAFTDDLDSTIIGLVATGLPASNICGAGSTLTGTSFLSLAGASLAPEASCTFTVTLQVPGGAATGSYTNTTSAIISNELSPGAAASDNLNIVAALPLLSKTFLTDPVGAGDTVTLEFTIDNPSATETMTALAFTDDISGMISGMTLVSLPTAGFCGASALMGNIGDFPDIKLNMTGGSLAPSASCTFSVDLGVPAGAPAATYTNTTSDITATVGGSTVTGLSATDTLTVTGGSINFTKEFTDDPAAPGGTATLEFTIENPAEAPADVTALAFTDDLNAALTGLAATGLPLTDICGIGSTISGTTSLSFTGGALSPGETCTFSVTTDVPAAALPGNYTNTTSDLTGTSSGVSFSVPAASADLMVSGLEFTKEFIDDPVAPGDPVTLEFTVTNASATLDATAMFFTDNLGGIPVTPTDLPKTDICGVGSQLIESGSLLIFIGGNLLAGESCTFNTVMHVPSDTISGTFNNVTSNLSVNLGGTTVILDPATDDLEVLSAANDVTLAKSFTNSPVEAGETATLEFTLNNASVTDAASAVSFTDNLDAMLSGAVATGTPIAGCGGTLSGTSTLLFSGGSIPASSNCNFSVDVTVPVATLPGTYTNTTGDVSATVNGVGGTSDPAIADLVVTAGSATFTKSFTDDPVAPGDPVTMEFSITNTGGGALTDMRFTDDLDAVVSGLVATGLPANDICGSGSSLTGTSSLNFVGGNLAIGGSCTFSVNLTVPAGATAGASYSNTTSDLTSGVSIIAAAANDNLDIAGPEIVVEGNGMDISDGDTTPSTTDHTGFLGAFLDGHATTRTFTIRNTGSGVLTLGPSAVSFSGASPGDFSVSTAPAETIAPGGSTTVTVEFDPTSIGIRTATLEINNDDDDEAPFNFSVSGTAYANPEFTKTFSPDTIATGGVSTLAFSIMNNSAEGPMTSTAFTDNLPAGMTVATPPNVIGNTCGGTITATAGTNVITASGLAVPLSCGFNVDVTSTTIGANVNTTGNLTGTQNAFTFTASAASDTLTVNEAVDLSVTKTDGVTSAVPGGSLTYTIVAANAGPSDEPTATLTDTFPADLTCTFTSAAAGGATGNTAAGSGDLSETLALPSGSSVTYTASCDIDAGASGTLSNTATISGTIADSDAGNNSATDADTVLGAEADVSITKTDGITSVIPGQSLTYTIVAANAGPSHDTSVTVTDNFPSDLTCSYTSVATSGATNNTPSGSGDISDTLRLQSGSSVTYTAVCTVDNNASGTLSNTATIASSVTDTNTGNNSATDNDTVIQATADLSVSLSDSLDPVTGGDSLAFTATVDNLGPSAATNTVATVTLPAGVTFVSTSGCAEDPNGNPTCTLGNIASGSDASFTINVTVDNGINANISTTVSASSSETDPVAGNNSATETTTIANEAPTADAGPDQPSVDEASTVSLDGTASSDPNGDALTYAWIQTSGSPTVTLSDDTASSPTFTAPTLASNTPVTLTFSLVVNDGLVDSAADTVDITINNINETPTADAGPDQPAVNEATMVTLDGTGSADPDSDGLTYKWTQTGGTGVTLSDDTASSPTFTAPTLTSNTPETLTFSLVVDDGIAGPIKTAAASPSDTVEITIVNINETPTADAGPDQPSVDEATLVTLDGTGSSDPDGDSLTYQWVQTSGTGVTLSDDTASSPTFTAPTLTSNTPVTLTFSLVVNDGLVDSVADTVDITITNINETPTADAGPDQPSVDEATLVTLDGTGSSDPDGDGLTYQWVQTSGTGVTLSDDTASSPTFTAPTLTSNTPVTLTFSLVVSDGLVDSVADTVDITITNINETPIADAGPDQPSVDEATMVSLDGTGSSDPDGDSLTYQWVQTAGDTVTLSDDTASSPTFTAPTLTSNMSMTMTFSLVVSDGLLDSASDTIDVTISNINEAPTADAGPDQTSVDEATMVSLDGTGSSDPDGDTLTYQWVQTAGTGVTLSDDTASSPTFTAPTLSSNSPETLTFSLVVNDGTVNSVADTVDITITNINETPIADAGPDQPSVDEATLVTLDGTASSDPDGDTLTYQWVQTVGTGVTLSDDTASSPTFTAPTLPSNVDETLTFSLVVNDGFVDSVADSVDITITNINETPIADAGADQPSVDEATLVTLDGTASSDPDGDTLTYQWVQTVGTGVTLSDDTASSPTFTAPTLPSNADETLTFSLVVNDGFVDSVADTVDITITNINETPIADAGADQPSVDEATLVTLDGTASSDPDGDALTYQWVQTAGTGVTLSDDTASSPTFTAPTLPSNADETLTFSLIVNDGLVDSVADTVDITITNINETPIADAGPDQPSVDEATLVTLDGTASSDPDGDALTYQWVQTVGTGVTLSDDTASSPTFTAPTLTSNTDETLTFSLVVNDGLIDSVADTIDVTITNINETPIADAGPDQPSVDEATLVTLDGTASSDPDGDTLTYKWVQTVGTGVTLSDDTASSPTFIAPTLASNTDETLTFSLVVNDGLVDSVADTIDVTITNINETPTADAGPDQPSVDEATLVSLDGTASSDPDGDTLTYMWVQTAGTGVTLSDDTASSPTFTAPTLSSNADETLTFSLVVNDGLVDSVADTVDITIININDAPIADAGADQPSVDEASSVSLDGTGSSDPDGDALTYKWVQTVGTGVTLSDDTAASPTFTAPTLSSNTSETLTFSLVVSDGLLESVTDTVDITINNINETPTADAGPDQTSVDEATLVSLDGTGSSDPDGDTLTYTWTQTNGPGVTLSDASASSPTFTAPTLTSNVAETLTFSLIVSDGIVDSVADTVNVTINNINEAPTAMAGTDQTDIAEATTVNLDGTGSTDPDGDTLTYSWTQTAGVSVTLSDASASSPSFTAPGVATTTALTFELIVNDGFVDSVADDVSVTILENTPPTVVISGVPDISNAPFTATFTFSEDVTGFEIGDIVFSNGTGSDFAGSGTTYTVLVTAVSDGTITIDVPADVATDSAGNGNIAADQASTVIDTAAPEVVLSGVPESVRSSFPLTITFNEVVTGFEVSDITVVNGSLSGLIQTTAQSYIVTVTPITHGSVTMSVAAAVALDTAGNPNTASNTVSTDYIDEDFVRTRTMATINNFMARRADQITLNDPDLSLRMLNKPTGGRISGTADNDRANVTLLASATGDDAQLHRLIGADAASKVNFWVEGNYSRVNQGTAKNNLALLYAGADYALSDDTILGFMAQYDWADEEDQTQGVSVSGKGWMVGPYVVARLSDKLIFDSRASWGKSTNDVSPFNTYTDEFKTDRWLLKGQLTGDLTLDDWQFNPGLAVIYFEDKQKAYTDSLNINIPGQTISLGRATMGPRFSKTFDLDTMRLTPSFEMRGVWDFDQAQIVSLDSGLAQSTDELRMRTEFGLMSTFQSGTSLSLDGFYDGIGASNFEAYGVKANLSLSFD